MKFASRRQTLVIALRQRLRHRRWVRKRGSGDAERVEMVVALLLWLRVWLRLAAVHGANILMREDGSKRRALEVYASDDLLDVPSLSSFFIDARKPAVRDTTAAQ